MCQREGSLDTWGVDVELYICGHLRFSYVRKGSFMRVAPMRNGDYVF